MGSLKVREHQARFLVGCKQIKQSLPGALALAGNACFCVLSHRSLKLGRRSNVCSEEAVQDTFQKLVFQDLASTEIACCSVAVGW